MLMMHRQWADDRQLMLPGHMTRQHACADKQHACADKQGVYFWRDDTLQMRCFFHLPSVCRRATCSLCMLYTIHHEMHRVNLLLDMIWGSLSTTALGTS